MNGTVVFLLQKALQTVTLHGEIFCKDIEMERSIGRILCDKVHISGKICFGSICRNTEHLHLYR